MISFLAGGVDKDAKKTESVKNNAESDKKLRVTGLTFSDATASFLMVGVVVFAFVFWRGVLNEIRPL